MRLNVEIMNLIHSGQYKRAEELVEDLLQNSFEDKYQYAIALFHLSWLQRGKGIQLSEVAIATTAQLASLALELQNPYLIALALFRRGDISFCKGRLAQAKSDWEQAEKLLSELNLNDCYEMGWLKYHLALVYRDLHGYQLALPHFQTVLNLTSLSDSLRYKVTREIFFCFCFLKEYHEAYKCFETLTRFSPYLGSEIDIELFRAHLAIVKRNFRSARKLLLSAAQTARRNGIGRDRYDFSFHIAYLYAQKKDSQRALLFISKNTDPIYKLQIFDILLSQRNFKVLLEYETLGLELGLAQHIEKALQHRKMRQTTGLKQLDLSQTTLLSRAEVKLLSLLAT